jgi:Gluconate 2-dehydrogenase subunit 3
MDACETRSCLSDDEAQFIDAAFARILKDNDPALGAAGHVDRKLRALGGSSNGPGKPSTAALYKAGIAAVQAHCVRAHRRRFQHLPASEHDAALALLEGGHGFGGIGQFQVLFWMLVNDAVDAHFESTRS